LVVENDDANDEEEDEGTHEEVGSTMDVLVLEAKDGGGRS